MANAMLNTNPEELRACLAVIPDGEPMPCIYAWNVRIPLHYVPTCIELAIDKPNGWRPEYIDAANASLQRNVEIKKILLEKFCGFSFDEEIPFLQYGLSGAGFIYSNELDATVEDVFLTDDTSQLTKSGATELDIDLYCACCKFQFDEVERLLKLGANPNAKICAEGEEWWCLDRIGTEASCVGLNINDILIKKRTVNMEIGEYKLIADLISLAANEKMYRLLDKYRKENTKK